VRGAARAAAPVALALALGGCGILPALGVPTWVPLIGGASSGKLAATRAEPPRTAPLLSRGVAPDGEQTPPVDRVVCVVNNDAITLYELEEYEAHLLYESKESPPEGEAREAFRKQILDRFVDDRLQLQQAEREKLAVDDIDINERMAEVMKRLSAQNEKELDDKLKEQGLSLESAKKRVRNRLLVDRIVSRRVRLRVSVTEQEVDRYLEQNREKLEVGLGFEASHILFVPPADSGDDGWQTARRRADEASARLLGGEEFAEVARQTSDDPSGKDGGRLGKLKRGELAPEIEATILRLRTGEVSTPFRSGVGYHIFRLDSREMLGGEALTQARGQVRDILFREKYDARLKEWLGELRQRAIIDVRL